MKQSKRILKFTTDRVVRVSRTNAIVIGNE
jgi:hypothetical protein